MRLGRISQKEIKFMAVILIFLCLGPAAFGVFLIADFALWEARGVKTAARIEDFQKGRRFILPVLSFIKMDGSEARARAERIDQVIYLLGAPQKDDVLTIIYMEEEGK